MSDISISQASLCAFYRGADGFASLLLPFLRDGLSGGENCVGILDSAPPSGTLSLFDEDEVAARCGRLTLVSSWETCRERNQFSADKMLSWLAGRNVSRVAVEMTWALRAVVNPAELHAYEMELVRVLRRFPLAMMCLYDLDSLDGGTMVEVLNSHRRVLVGGLLIENPFSF